MHGSSGQTLTHPSDAPQGAADVARAAAGRGRAAATAGPQRASYPAPGGAPPAQSSAPTVGALTRMPGTRSGARLACPQPQLLSEDGELLRIALQQEDIDYWRARAGRLAGVPGAGAKARYATARAGALARPLRRKVERCGRHGKAVKCGCPGRREPALFGCRQWWFCPDCRKRRGKRLSRRLADSLGGHLDGMRRRWAGYQHKAPIIHLITLTVEHSGDLRRDHDEIALGWRGLYLHLKHELGRDIAYALVWEVTPGRDQLGHVHAHVAMVAPWFDYGDARGAWLRACPRSMQISFVPEAKGSRTPRMAAKYLGKYLSKGVEHGRFDEVVRAQVAAAFYNQRSVTTSHRFFLAWQPCCPQCGQRIVAALDERVAAWLRAHRGNHREDAQRGPPPEQCDGGGPPVDLWDAAGLFALDETGALQGGRWTHGAPDMGSSGLRTRRR